MVQMRTLCRELSSTYTGSRCPNDPLGDLQEQYRKLKGLSGRHPRDVIAQSSEMAGIAFLLGQKQFASMERTYSTKQYEKILFRLYAPHHDRIGYKTRIADIGERLANIRQAFHENQILPESAQMEQVKNTLSLAVDCLRLSAYVEREQNQTQRRETPCPEKTEQMAMQQ